MHGHWDCRFEDEMRSEDDSNNVAQLRHDILENLIYSLGFWFAFHFSGDFERWHWTCFGAVVSWQVLAMYTHVGTHM